MIALLLASALLKNFSGKEWVPVAGFNGEACAENAFMLTVDSTSACERRYQGNLFGFQTKGAIDKLHFLSSGAVSFARGLNDTPKIAALLLVTGTWSSPWYLVLAASAIALGGLVNARRVALTMSHKLTDMNPGQGLAANLFTALLVTAASLHGLPVSTTHVGVGSLLGMGTVTGQAKWKSILRVLAS